MHADLAFQIAVGVFPFNQHAGTFQARFLAVEIIQGFHGVAAALAPAAVHAVKHLRPVLRFRSARPGMKSQNGVLFVILSGQKSRKVLGTEIGTEFLQFPLSLRKKRKFSLLVRKLNQRHQVLVGRFQTRIRGYFIFQRTGTLKNLLGLIHVVPEIPGRSFLVQLGDFFFHAFKSESLGQFLQLRFQFLKRKPQFFKLQHNIIL